jgi:uncharacterized protein (TIGR02996 family)
MTTREALEAALLANPDDAVRHAAYADLLLEQGDPRGEFIRLQLAAEDRNQSIAKLRELEDSAHKIRQEHEREWLGDLWPFVQRPPSARSVAEPMEPNVEFSWKRGWVDGVRIWQLSNPLVRAIATHPLTRLLGSFAVVQNTEPMEIRTAPYEMPVRVGLQSLIDAGRFAHLLHFEVGSVEERVTAEGYELDDAVEAMPKLESIRLCVDLFSESGLFGGEYPHLHTIDITYNNPRCRFYILGMNDGLPNLRRLSLDTVAIIPERGEIGSEREPITPGDLSMFFRSRYLAALEYFTFRNGEFGDEGVEELLASGFITRLRGLDLCRCNITDAGAELLARHPHVRSLEYLHLDNNLLSPVGIDALEAVGQTISPNQFFGPMPRDYMAEFDAQIRAELGMDEEEEGDNPMLDPERGLDPDEIDFGDDDAR